jgi:putative flavoprotein involved in K+ transport
MAESEATRQVSRLLSQFEDLLTRQDIAGAIALFAEESYWRDLVSFTWNIATMEGKAGIQAMLEATLARVQPYHWRLDGKATIAGDVTQAWFIFETAVSRGKGHVRLKGGKIFTLFTVIQELKGFEEKRGETREEGMQLGAMKGRRSWLENKLQDETELGVSRQPYCLIVGGGQGGLGLGARLKRLGVPTLIVDKHERPGDAWRKRYKSLCLHDAVWYDHMPYLPFPDHWPVYSPKDKIGDWLEMYAKVMELNAWSSTECQKAHYDEAAQEWVVTVDRDGEKVTLRPKQLVLATGMSGMPNVPRYSGADLFAGKQHHSSQHRGGEGYAGLKCVVVGSNNSAHDICADLWEHGAEVTMIQRSSTCVVPLSTLRELGKSGPYSEAALKAGIDVNKADLIVGSTPYRIIHHLHAPVAQRIQKQDAAFYDSLRAVGFNLDFGEDDTGIGMKYLRRGSGYYIDVGGSALIAERQIALKNGEVVEIRQRSVVLSDGSEIEADLIVYATGYGSMNGWAAELISQEVADKVGKCWGLGSGTANDPGPWEGELRNMWKPTAQEGLWFHGGNLAQSRHYSLYLALQLKARMEGLATPVYGRGEVHHVN